ncbi:MAG: hypothetical protein OEY81_05925, partial [Candidatus Bathyarchaeota archaeon]|nr:hypothetical protein [Candidatus Bathyarchaeota archaeon]
NPKILSAVEKLKALGFNPVFLTSETANIQKLGKMATHEVQMVKNAFKQIPSGIYGKRIMSFHQAYLNREEFTACVDAANLEKLAKMLRVLGFLTQTKVYLIWKNPTTHVQVTK